MSSKRALESFAEEEEEKKSTVSTSSHIGEQGRKKKIAKSHGRLRSVEGEEDDSLEQFNDRGDRFTSFNLKEENEDGHFDGAGNFVWRKEEKAVQEDAWLDGVSTQEIREAFKAREARKIMSSSSMSSSHPNDDDDEAKMDQAKAVETLVRVLKPKEKVLEGLKRLGSKRGKKQGEDEKQKFIELTEAADFMMGNGIVDIYQHTKETYATKHVVAKTVRYEGRDAPENIQWEYKGQDGNVYGPFSTQSMLAWQSQGYFTGKSAVSMRIVVPSMSMTSKNSSAEEQLMDDFADEEDDEDEQQQQPWHNSDEIDFETFMSVD